MSARAPPAAGAAAAAAAGAGGAAARGNRRDGQAESGGAGSTIKNAIIMFAVMQFVQYGVKQFIGGNNANKPAASDVVPAPAPGEAAAASDGSTGSAATKQQQPPNILPLWEQGTVFDAYFYVTASPYGQINFDAPALPHTSYTGLKFGDWTWKEEWNTEVALPANVQNNGSLFLETILTRNGSPIDPSRDGFKTEDVHYTRTQLTQYRRQPRIRAVKNLISGTSDEPEETEEEARLKDGAMPIISFYHPNVTVNLVSNSGPFPQAQLAPAIVQYMRILPPAEGTLNQRYQPIVYPNTFWQMKSASYPVNQTISSVPLNIVFEPVGITKFQILASLDDSFKQAAEKPGMGTGADFDEFKRVLIETNPILLITTVIVTVLHMLFEMLAFKSDVSHWRNQKDQVGVSLRTIITNVFVQLIITLYLFDNSTETSWMILFSQGMGLLIEAWKITKVVDIKLVSSTTGILPYTLQIKDKHVLSKLEKETQEYDKLAFKYVTWGTTPFLVGYTIYSLLYESHRGWYVLVPQVMMIRMLILALYRYSFVISTLTSFVYMFGFIQLIPQLIINYKLKSVAHMPLKSLTYKALNTVVDDFFSFIIKQPLMHRLACFRDDVVFVVLLYQYWIYPVDKKRANEYGQVGEDPTAGAEKSEPEKEDAKGVAVKESRKDR